MRRFQKPLEERREADLVDLYIALQIGLDAITQTVSELDEKELRIFKAIKEGNRTCREVADATGVPYKTCYRYIEYKLIEQGYVNKDKEGGRNVYTVFAEKNPKTLLISEGRNLDNPKQLMEFILHSFNGFSLSHQGESVTLFDPLCGDKVIVEHKDEDWIVRTEPCSPEVKFYPFPDLEMNNTFYPREKVRTFETGEKQASLDQLSTKTLRPSEMRNENELITKLPSVPSSEGIEDTVHNNDLSKTGFISEKNHDLQDVNMDKKPSIPQEVGAVGNSVTEEAKAVFRWKQVKPSEKCPLCGKLAVEYEISIDKDTFLRRCSVCYNLMRTKFIKAKWVLEENEQLNKKGEG
jgi:hypothetical protein